MDRMNKEERFENRNLKVIKSNELIQKTRFQLSSQQQKALLYIISKIKPEQDDFEYQTFNILDFCDVCGIDPYQGKNHKNLKATLQVLSDKSMWITETDGTEILMRWLISVQIKPRSGKVQIMIDPHLKPYLLQLRSRFTQFELKYTLAMHSKYSVRLYEILKSYAALNEPIRFTVDRFRNMVGAEYELWYDLKRKVIDIALKEINTVSDLKVAYEGIKRGRSYIAVEFYIEVKQDFYEQVLTHQAIAKELGG